MLYCHDLLELGHINHGFGEKTDPCPKEAVTLKQIHSNLVVDINTLEDAQTTFEADGLITQRPGVTLAIKTADCVPILLAHRTQPIVAALHAGWRGASRGIIKTCIETFIKKGYDPKDIIASIGPCIKQPSFEVGKDVVDAFNSPSFFAPVSDEKYLLDLFGWVKLALSEQGIGKVVGFSNDTYSQKEQFFSYRRACHENTPLQGHQWSWIRI